MLHRSFTRRLISTRSKYLIETEELATLLSAKNKVKVIDATWSPQLNVAALFEKQRLTTDTVLLDLGKISEPSKYINTFPSLERFNK